MQLLSRYASACGAAKVVSILKIHTVATRLAQGDPRIQSEPVEEGKEEQWVVLKEELMLSYLQNFCLWPVRISFGLGKHLFNFACCLAGTPSYAKTSCSKAGWEELQALIPPMPVPAASDSK